MKPRQASPAAHHPEPLKPSLCAKLSSPQCPQGHFSGHPVHVLLPMTKSAGRRHAPMEKARSQHQGMQDLTHRRPAWLLVRCFPSLCLSYPTECLVIQTMSKSAERKVIQRWALKMWVGGMQCSYERFGKNMWASFFVLFISFYKVVIQSKNNIPFLQRQHSAGMHIFRSLCKQLPTFVRGRRMVPCAAEGGWTKTSQVSLQRGIGQEMDLRGRFSLGVNLPCLRNPVVNKW